MAKPSIGFAKCVMWGDDLKIISKIAPHLGVLFLAFYLDYTLICL